MTEQTEQAFVWAFAPEYREKFGGLPPSQQREALKRLTSRRRNPLTETQCAEPSAEVLACLEAVNTAYLNKKARSKASSATKRMIQKAQPQPEAGPVEELADAVAVVSLEPAEITAEEPAPAPQPAPAPVLQKSTPIAIPKKTVPLAAAEPAAAEPAKVPSTPAKKKGLAGRFA